VLNKGKRNIPVLKEVLSITPQNEILKVLIL